MIRYLAHRNLDVAASVILFGDPTLEIR
jgi:hypothetical protein